MLLSGATGFVAMELLARYLERSDRDVFTLVRARDDAAARERIDEVLANLFGSRGARRYADRVHAVAGELTEPGLGLTGPRQGAGLRGDHGGPQRRFGVVHAAT